MLTQARRRLIFGLLTWAALTLIATFGSCARFAINGDPPSERMGQWALSVLDGSAAEAPESWVGEGPNVIIGWHEGMPAFRYVGDGDLEADVRDAVEAFAGTEETIDQFTVEVSLGRGPVILDTMYLSELSMVPLHDGLIATHASGRRVLSPEELRSRGTYDHGITTPIPDLTLGLNVRSLAGALVRDMGLSFEEFEQEGTIERFRSHTFSRTRYPRDVEVSMESMRQASIDGAEFLLRHMQDGRFAYVYEPRQDVRQQSGYNIPRHSGSTYFLAQVGRAFEHAEARAGALNALRWVNDNVMGRCGETRCVVEWERADVGSAALTVVAAAEVLLGGEDPLARTLVEDLSAFLRAQQRPDGELMHEYDVTANEPIDVQHLYYSGEAAFALLRAYVATGEEANLEAARGVMSHLTGASWDFFGSRYYYGEEHWTCIAAAEGYDELRDPDGLDFCARWAEFNDVLQFDEGQTPWEAEGAYGVGPVVVPRLTPVGSRSEAFVGTYEMMRDAGMDTTQVRRVVERGLEQLLRYQFRPGPTHLFADPEGAYGAIPGSPVDLRCRNDFTQHAGSSFVRWYEVLQEEAQTARE